MEQQRTTTALILCFLVWTGWMMFFAPRHRLPAGNAPVNGVPPANQPDQPANVPGGNGPGPEVPVTGDFEHPEVPEKTWTASGKRFDVEFTNRGASVRTLTLREILDQLGGAPMKLLQSFDPDKSSLAACDAAYGEAAMTANWEVLVPEPDELARFRYTYANGLQLTKTIAADPANYALAVTLKAKNLGPDPLRHELLLAGAQGIMHDTLDAQYHMGVRGRINDKGHWTIEEDVSVDKLKKEGPFTAPLAPDWGGVTSKYFTALLIPDPTGPDPRDRIAEFRWRAVVDHAQADQRMAAWQAKEGREATFEEAAQLRSQVETHIGLWVRMAAVSLEPGQEAAQSFTFFAGPRRYEDVAPYAKYGLDHLIDFGWFTAIANLLLAVLGWLYSIFGNYGVAIIFLTLGVKICLFPLTRKAQVSAFKMQQVSPKMKALQEKFESDKPRLQVEMLKLYREHGVNPVMGCLPMFFQIPVLIGLYRGLDRSFELRQQPFFGWVSDLSRPDVLFSLPWEIPLTGTNEFHLLPILMTITWMIQSAMMPKSPDPQMQQQQKMMMFMPLIFAFMLYSSASGLILYWFTSTLLGIAEQQFIKRKYLK